MPGPRRDADIRQWVEASYPDLTSLEKDTIVRKIISDQIGAAYQRGDITLDQWHKLQMEYGEIHFVTPFETLRHMAESGWLTDQIMSAGGELRGEISNVISGSIKIIDDVARMTSEEDNPFTFGDDGEFHSSQDESIDLWDDISVEAEVTTGDDDIQVVDDIEVIEETMIDEGWFYEEEEVPDLNPVDDFEDWVYPVERDIRDDDIQDYIAYPEQEINDAVSFANADDQYHLSMYGLTVNEYLDYVAHENEPTGIENDDILYNIIDEPDPTADIINSDTLFGFVDGIVDQEDFSVIDLPTFSDDVYIDIVNEFTEDHMNVLSFQFFDSDNVIFDRF